MKNLTLLIMLASALALSACTAKSTIYRAPDETSVETRKDLTLPPDYELRPPVDKK